jgi:ATP phosphoribosyltransferase regulatory subunit
MTDRDTRAAELLALFAREGYERVEPPILQPAEIFLDLSGEDIRRRMFVTQDAASNELCLRPEYTIPVCRHHIAAGSGGAASYAYHGPVFRLRAGETGEFLQAGVESIGRHDYAAADAEIVGLAIEGVALLGLADPQVTLGDMALLEAVLEALDITGAAKRRVVRSIVSRRPLAGEPAGRTREHAGLLAAIEGQDPKAAKAFVEDVLSIAGISSVGGRSAGEIAERFLAKASNPSGDLAQEALAVLSRYLAVRGDPDSAAAQIRALAAEAGLNLSGALDQFEERNGFMAARGLDIGAFVFAADFARNLDYYTGFIFEAVDPRRPEDKPVIGGGRYDRLLQHLGALSPVPAVGCSVWIERVGAGEPA